MLTPKQAAEILSVHPETLRRWEQEGKINSTKTAGGHRRFLESDVEGFKKGLVSIDSTIEPFSVSPKAFLVLPTVCLLWYGFLYVQIQGTNQDLYLLMPTTIFLALVTSYFVFLAIKEFRLFGLLFLATTIASMIIIWSGFVVVSLSHVRVRTTNMDRLVALVEAGRPSGGICVKEQKRLNARTDVRLMRIKRSKQDIVLGFTYREDVDKFAAQQITQMQDEVVLARGNC